MAVAALACCGQRLILGWRASRCGAGRHMCCLRRRRLGRRCARLERAAPAPTLARVTVWREGGTCAASGGGGLAVAALARRGQRRLLSWRASRCGAGRHICRLRRRRLGCCCARTARAAPASILARVTMWREGGTCAASGGGGLAVAALAGSGPAPGLARVTGWRGAARVPPQAAVAWPLLRLLSAGCASFYAGARHGVARGGTCAASGGGGLAVAALARRGLRQLLRWRASRCCAGQHMCCLRRWRLGCRRARSAQAAPASTLARVTMWRGAAYVPPQAAAAWPLLRSLDVGCAGFYAGARHGVIRRCHVCRPRRRRLGRCCARSAQAAPASTLARVTVWREEARVPPQAAAAWLSLRPLGAGCAGFYAGARHGVARGSTCAASCCGGLAVAALARRGLRRLQRWRASRCGAEQHMCRLRRVA